MVSYCFVVSATEICVYVSFGEVILAGFVLSVHLDIPPRSWHCHAVRYELTSMPFSDDLCVTEKSSSLDHAPLRVPLAPATSAEGDGSCAAEVEVGQTTPL